jgi:hypothetical protein
MAAREKEMIDKFFRQQPISANCLAAIHEKTFVKNGAGYQNPRFYVIFEDA